MVNGQDFLIYKCMYEFERISFMRTNELIYEV
jgi:hypothetical protein